MFNEVNSHTKVSQSKPDIYNLNKPDIRVSYFQRQDSHQEPHLDMPPSQTKTPQECFLFDTQNKNKIISYNPYNLNTCPRHVIIPEFVIYIGRAAFMRKNLSSVSLPKSVRYIEYLAFADNHLSSLTLPENLISIGASAFADNHLTHITIPQSTLWIDDHAFYNNDLKEVNILSTEITILKKAFRSNGWWTRICINNLSNKTKIDGNAFDRTAQISYSCFD